MNREGILRVASVALLAFPFTWRISSAQTFRDDFEGNQLDSTNWIVESSSPADVVVAGGFMTLTNSSSSFPVVLSRHDFFPSGDFRVRVGFRYPSQGFCGDGFGTLDNFWENYGGAAVCRPFMIWQDSGGLYTYTGSIGGTVLLPAPETASHLAEWTYISGEYRLYMDGVLRATGACAPRATTLFFGHPHPISCGGPWSTLSIDYVEISPLGSTSIPPHSWGRLKEIYR